VDVIVLVVLVVSFAVFATSHVALVFGLILRSPRWRGAAALLVPPLAPFWGVENRMYVRSALWLAALVTYVATRFLAVA
jgi:hypothetical protein